MPQITISYPAGDGARFAAALGKAQSLVDSQVPPQPRAETAAECKTFVIQRVKQLIVDVEGSEAEKAARNSVVIAPVDMT